MESLPANAVVDIADRLCMQDALCFLSMTSPTWNQHQDYLKTRSTKTIEQYVTKWKKLSVNMIPQDDDGNTLSIDIGSIINRNRLSKIFVSCKDFDAFLIVKNGKFHADIYYGGFPKGESISAIDQAFTILWTDVIKPTIETKTGKIIPELNQF